MATETPTRRRFTAHDYHRMGEDGILSADDRTELIDGEVVLMTPIGGRHAACVNALNRLLMDAVEPGSLVSVQNPVRLDDFHEPQPDLAVLHARDDYSRGRLPGPGDVTLLIEVADTTLGYDRNVKLPLYASAGIGEVWIVDVSGGLIERHADPVAGVFGRTERAVGAQILESVALPGLALAPERVLG